MNITQDVVDEILSRLPVKSLIRFKVVCKNWYSNIQSHSFIAKHIKNQSMNEKLMIYHIIYNLHPTVLIRSDQEEERKGEDEEEKEEEEEEGEDDDVYSQIHLPSDCLDEYGVEIIASCSGLVCFCYDTFYDIELDVDGKCLISITVWNPATRDFKTLPPPPGPRAIRSGDVVGFGFDVTHNDYKVIRISQLLKHEYRHIQPCGTSSSSPFPPRLNKDISRMNIYSLRSNIWREFDCSSDLSTEIITPANSMGAIFGKEKFCWLAGDSSGKERMILSFDMGKEVFQKTPLPSDYVHLEKPNSGTELFNLHDSIALVRFEERDTEMTYAIIWIIKNLEQKSSPWIKLANVGPLSGTGWALGFCKGKNRNDFLFLIDDYWNDKDEKFIRCVYMNNRDQVENDRLMAMKVKTGTDIDVATIKVATYVETLVSLNRDHN